MENLSLKDLKNEVLHIASGTSSDSEAWEIILKRHDDHNLELKSMLQFQKESVQGVVDLYFFLPKNVQLRSYNKYEISVDFFSRQRLFIPQNSKFRLDELKNKLILLEKIISSYSHSDALLHEEKQIILQDIYSQVQSLGAFMGEYIKAISSKAKKDLTLIQSHLRNHLGFKEDFADLMNKLEALNDLVSALRAATDKVEAINIPVVQLLDEYIHHLYVEALGKIKDIFYQNKRLGKETTIPETYWNEFDDKLKFYLSKEMLYQKKHNITLKQMSQLENSELLIVRLGQMKKFFQAKMFIQVLKKQTIKKLTEPMAAIGASFAAIAAGVVQHYGSPSAIDYSFGGISIAMFGMALYVLRDRLKDLGRNYLLNYVVRFLPDSEYNLKTENGHLGKIKEWIKILDPSEISPVIQAIRKKSCVSEAENYLQEDVIHLKRHFSLIKEMSLDGNHCALQDNLRINLERYLKHLDDPQKDIVLLNKDGHFSKVTTNKVYYFYIIVDYQLSPQNFDSKTQNHDEQSKVKSDVYRVVMNKNGLLKVKPLLLT
ncbi:MAG: hypothetical protein HUU56_12485 [Bdellovibrionaceae bacterium]|nr:hypothetical protein [Pseudobdellovibrionaceae bacterium]